MKLLTKALLNLIEMFNISCYGMNVCLCMMFDITYRKGQTDDIDNNNKHQIEHTGLTKIKNSC